eukprot:403126-Amphidinium_carterae.1
MEALPSSCWTILCSFAFITLPVLLAFVSRIHALLQTHVGAYALFEKSAVVIRVLTAGRAHTQAKRVQHGIVSQQQQQIRQRTLLAWQRSQHGVYRLTHQTSPCVPPFKT